MTESKSIQIVFEPAHITVDAVVGEVLSSVLSRVGIEFAYPCAGAHLCGRCRVTFREGAPDPTDEEKRLLAFRHIEAGVRLACCAVLTSDAVVELPVVQASHTEHILTSGVRSDVVVDPEVLKFACSLPESTLEKPLSDWARIVSSLPERLSDLARPTLNVLQKLPEVVRKAEAKDIPLTVMLRLHRVIDVEVGDSTAHQVGVAVDLGTTTISAVLVDMTQGTELVSAGCMNPQRRFGHDLISRIGACGELPENLGKMQEEALWAISGLIKKMCKKINIVSEKICSMALAGNTAMSHLFLKIDPSSLGTAPFAGTLRAGVRLEAQELDIPIHPHAPVYVLPCVGGFVGGDITAGVLVTRLLDLSGVSVMVDIGTNGEVVVARDGQMCATSSAAGPSFEGGRIGCGMIASPGAIDRVDYDGVDLKLSTLDDMPPVGVCGSGLIEFFTRALEVGLIGMNGSITTEESAISQGLSDALIARLNEDLTGRRITLIAAQEGREEIAITQQDVREFQLAKGAIQAAVRMTLDELNITPDQIDRFLVAGAFGAHLNLADAMGVGLLPQMPVERVHFIGNSSLEGARCVLLNRYERQRAELVAGRTKFLDLASKPEFQDRFAMAMFLGPPLD